MCITVVDFVYKIVLLFVTSINVPFIIPRSTTVKKLVYNLSIIVTTYNSSACAYPVVMTTDESIYVDPWCGLNNKVHHVKE